MKILTLAEAFGQAPRHRRAADMHALNCYLFIFRPYLKVELKFRLRLRPLAEVVSSPAQSLKDKWSVLYNDDVNKIRKRKKRNHASGVVLEMLLSLPASG